MQLTALSATPQNTPAAARVAVAAPGAAVPVEAPAREDGVSLSVVAADPRRAFVDALAALALSDPTASVREALPALAAMSASPVVSASAWIASTTRTLAAGCSDRADEQAVADCGLAAAIATRGEKDAAPLRSLLALCDTPGMSARDRAVSRKWLLGKLAAPSWAPRLAGSTLNLMEKIGSREARLSAGHHVLGVIEESAVAQGDRTFLPTLVAETRTGMGTAPTQQASLERMRDGLRRIRDLQGRADAHLLRALQADGSQGAPTIERESDCIVIAGIRVPKNH